MHLGLDRMDLLAHSAGSVLATLYAAAYPERLSRLILVTPGLAAVGVHGTEEDMRAALERSAAEPWYPAALAALEKILDGDLSMEAFRASRPLFYGRWDEVAQAHATAGTAERYLVARAGYFAGVDLDVSSTRAALKRLLGRCCCTAGSWTRWCPLPCYARRRRCSTKCASSFNLRPRTSRGSTTQAHSPPPSSRSSTERLTGSSRTLRCPSNKRFRNSG